MKIEIPKNCPCCDYPLELVNDQLFCKNPSCSAQLNKKLEHFSKVLGIKGMGPKTIEKLNISDITEIFYLDRDNTINLLGSEKIADKLLNEIDKARNASLATVLSSFSIPLVGETASNKIAKFVSNIEEITPELCKQAGLGEKVTNNLITWINTEYQELKEFLPFDFSSKQVTISAEKTLLGKICITGKLHSFKTKAEANKALSEAGFEVVDSVTKTTTYLVDEQGNSSSKRKKADEYGITIITNLNDFLKEIYDGKTKEMVC